MKALIVNADDFGHSGAVNAGIAEAHERGIVTSTSLMVRRQAAEEAAGYACAHPELSVGLHIDLGEWSYRTTEGWVALYEVDEEEIGAEIAGQLERFRTLLGRNPSHLDSHQHVHRRDPARSASLGLAEELGVPLRHFDPRVRYCGEFYGQSGTGEQMPTLITPEALVRVLSTLPEGMSELCCHPGKGRIPGSSYGPERGRELAALCDLRAREAVEAAGVALASFHDLEGTSWRG